MKQATVAAIRFGCGLGLRPQPANAAAVYDSLIAPDVVRNTYPMMSLQEAQAVRHNYLATFRAQREKTPGAAEAHQLARRKMGQIQLTTLRHVMARQMDAGSPLRERLNLFWLDHFSTRTKSLTETANAPTFVDEALRATMTLRFADMLRAVVMHPQMLLYLDQIGSVGPNSTIGKRQGRGLNENLAREMLELHTLGVGADYTQSDVRELAELLTGLQYRPEHGGFIFRHQISEPGAETVLGQSYGGAGRATLDDVFAVLDDLSVHPETARHMAWKLAVHFVSDTPDPALIAHVQARWLETRGDLMQVYAALLEHPAAWVPLGGKVKQPMDFIGSSLMAMGLSGADLIALPRQPWQEMVVNTLNGMGQPFLRAPGPDGWPEAAEAWITPLGLSQRIRWSMRSPGRLVKPLPDPREFVTRALDDAASPRLIWAVGAADTVAQGMGLVLASPEFNRR